MLLRRVLLVLCFAAGLACAPTLATALSVEQLRALGAEAARAATYTPKPNYPLAARAHRITGSGIFIVRVHVITGRVAEVLVGQSTGHAILDDAVVRAFIRWQFRPGALKPIGVAVPSSHYPFGKEDALLKIPCNFVLR